ncbi:DNA polymerase III subunit chi [Pseudaeromonas sp. ZJS20]|uniref:DNA polymerase III subunit chi n=1 Tax=Pseudaeromonas aegiceratis TaxID=3153928 RepID=UPI00390C83AA
MQQAQFHILADTTSLADARLACLLATQAYRAGQTVFILARDEAQAQWLDETLWQQDPDSFVPHALQDEPGAQQAAVEIGHQPPRRPRNLLINLQPEAPAFAGRFPQVIDFVPAEESLKQLARERYKQYRAAGFTLEMVQPG